MAESLFHLLDPSGWPPSSTVYTPEAFGAEGFVHCSYAEQLGATANRHYRDVPALIAVELDPRAVPEIRVEEGFPHVYGPIPVSAALAVHTLTRWAGEWTFSPETDPADPGR